MYDDKGYPSYMVRIPKFNLEDIDPDLGSGPHPAFIVNGQEKSEIWIGQYQAKVVDGRACSLPGVDPSVYMTYDQAVSYCKSKGAGWHLMTMHEWAAVMLWCLKNGFQPRGNTNWGRSHEATFETAARVDNGTPGSTIGTGRTIAGSGPVKWRHDDTFSGVADLVGNIWEWTHLFKIVDGRIYTPLSNDFDMDEASWPAQNAYFDSPVAGDGIGTSDLGEPILSDSVTNYAGPTGDSGYFDYNYDSVWNTLSIKTSWDPPLILKQLCVAPSKYDGTATSQLAIFSGAKGAFWVRNYGERIPLRGGNWGYAALAGLAALSLNDPRSSSCWDIGCRPAFVL
ncbi:formylglycine-generating enzyme family protein [Deferribacter autotrophicus]|uniref:Formylglycine-generating enzyme family protein n=2 Tax=Deferribacter autotrophicus TaxID=500465 RepID=A0A5A8F5V9_9BACT|nr:formylglycine-generating enzyme family protein [Deferribacter autotrophicus]